MRHPALHVLMTADAVGGVWTYAIELTRALSDRRVHVSLAVLGPSPSPSQRAEAAALSNLDLFEHAGRLEWMDDAWTDVADAGDWLVALGHRLMPDVVHLNGYAHAALPWQAPVLIAAHSCVLSWWRAVHGTDAPPVWDRYAMEVTRGLHAASLVVAPTAAMLAMLTREYGALARTRVIPNGRTVSLETPPVKAPCILTSGRLWDEAKNVDAVCTIAPSLAWPVYVAGAVDGPAAHRVLCATVRYLGRLDADTMAQWMARAAIYVLPARYEPFGLSVLEAAHAGCALVLGDVRSLREIWQDAALFVIPGNRRVLAAVVAQLIDDEPLRQQMADRARLRARAFTVETMADGYCQAYQELIGERRPLLSLGAV